jgi:hypothetical protein
MVASECRFGRPKRAAALEFRSILSQTAARRFHQQERHGSVRKVIAFAQTLGGTAALAASAVTRSSFCRYRRVCLDYIGGICEREKTLVISALQHHP